MAQDPRALLQKVRSLIGWWWIQFLRRKEEKYQDAAELYLQAANAFRWPASAFEKAASIQTTNLKEPDDAANTLVDAFKAYRTVDAAAAVRCLDVAINQYCTKGNFRRAAGHKEALGELRGGLVGDVAALEADYYKAIEAYERVAAASVSNNLMKPASATIATGDAVAARRAIDKYADLDPSFAGQREFALLNDLLAAVEKSDQDEFTDKLFQYDQVSKLDRWKTTLLVRVKGAIEEPEDEFA
ncbi:alpha-soluble NSF attachment protein [Verticillium dahliae]|nr:alpha-soluble NSF attachment protein [Verticillium dahliae]